MAENTSRSFDRRDLFKIGGATIALSAVVAACGGDNNGAGPVRVASAGTRPPLATTTTATVDDKVLLRTATSLHYNAMDVVDVVSGVAGLDATVLAAAKAYKPLLQAQADALAAATTAAGGTPFEEKNPTVDSRVVQPAVALLNVSDTKAGDAARLLHAVANFASESHQAFVVQFVDPALRQAAMSIGIVHAQVAASLAGVITPENIVPAGEVTAAEPKGVDATATTVAAGLPSTSVAATGTTAAAAGIPDTVVYMVPSAFGILSATQVVLGKVGVDDATKRQQLNIETPSLNSMVY